MKKFIFEMKTECHIYNELEQSQNQKERDRDREKNAFNLLIKVKLS